MAEQKKENYWAKVLFREFVSHYIEMDDSEIVEDVKKSVISLIRLDCSGNSFGSKMVRWAEERGEGRASVASAENGRKGGRPRKQAEMVKLPEHLVYGQNANVYLTQDQHTELAKRLGNIKELASLLDNFSNALSDGSRKSENHFATLCNWISYRNEKRNSGTPSNQIRFEDWNDKSVRLYNEAKARLNGGI